MFSTTDVGTFAPGTYSFIISSSYINPNGVEKVVSVSFNMNLMDPCDPASVTLVNEIDDITVDMGSSAINTNAFSLSLDQRTCPEL